jgi:peptidase A4-like protein
VRHLSLLFSPALVAAAAFTAVPAHTAAAALGSDNAPAGNIQGLTQALGNTDSTLTSGNWAGYAATGSTYNQVSTSWTEPAVNCAQSPAYAHSSFWDGFDGLNNGTVEQAGSTSDCDLGTASYYAWYEAYPNPQVQIPDPVQPGDAMSSNVQFASLPAGPTYEITVTDATQGWTYTTDQVVTGATRTSVEVIAEAPLGQFGQWPLADFGSVTFTGSTVDGQPFGALSPSQIDMAQSGVPEADTSALLGGTAFTVDWVGYY